MKLSNSLTILFIVAAVMFSVGFACSSDNSSSTTNTSVSNTTSTKSTPKSIAGEYDATGTNPTGTEYKAGLVVTPHDDVYQFTWTSGKNSYDGVGVRSDSEVAVSFTDGASGKGCGVVLFTINKDNSLDGKIGYWGNNSMETEKATPKSAGSLDGVYDIVGKNPDGKACKGKLIVIQSGDGYTFDWEAGTSFSGYGLRAGDYIAVGFGGKHCSFVGYDVQSDGTLKGKWGSQFARKFGTEIAKRK
ncbi:MAG: hypothetical protein ABIP78_00825 [Pyrinomonadaceae bacterium]